MSLESSTSERRFLFYNPLISARTFLLATPIHQQSKHHQMEPEQPNQSPAEDKKADNPEHINIKVPEAPFSRHAQIIY